MLANNMLIFKEVNRFFDSYVLPISIIFLIAYTLLSFSISRPLENYNSFAACFQVVVLTTMMGIETLNIYCPIKFFVINYRIANTKTYEYRVAEYRPPLPGYILLQFLLFFFSVVLRLLVAQSI